MPMPGWNQPSMIGVSMAGIDRSTARVIAVIALLFVAAWALRGYLPGSEREVERQQSSSPLALVVDIVLLSISVGIIGIAIITRLRKGETRRPAAARLAASGGTMGRPSWRFWLIALALTIGWVLLVTLLTRMGVEVPSDQAPSGAPTVADSGDMTPSTTNPAPQQPDPPQDPGTNAIGYLVPPMLILMALVVVGTAIASRRQRRLAAAWAVDGELPDAPSQVAAAESLARAAELGLAEIADLSREPREAIIACYAAMERELTHVPGAAPLDCDTPSEVLARAVDHHALRAESATQLVELFEEARFSPHVMNEGHRDIAVDALRLVLADLRSMA
jgi:Domain of unknown function (DUF4129)